VYACDFELQVWCRCHALRNDDPPQTSIFPAAAAAKQKKRGGVTQLTQPGSIVQIVVKINDGS
jgi:hypothetical protein